MPRIAVFAVALTLVAAGSAATEPYDGPWMSARVLKIDLAQSVATIFHDPVESIGMPAMTMTLSVADPSLVAGLQEDQQIEVRVAEVEGTKKIVAIRKASSGKKADSGQSHGDKPSSGSHSHGHNH